ncbi:MAG: ABC transporter permease [Oscillospiraceae bacterium]|nr:ABC transporter permease [Oscillospiraceae bacterium]
MKPKRRASRGAMKRRVWVFLVLALLLVALAIVAPALAPNDPNQTNSDFMKVAPCAQFPFGTDKLGRCVLSRVLMGARTSVFSALILVAVSFAFGTALGVLCGFFGGALDEIVMRVADILLAFPQMVLAIAVAGILGGSLANAMIAMGITGWTLYARLARSAVLSRKEESFIAAAKLSGCGSGRLLFRHILPNIFGPLLVNATTQIGTMMIGLAGLSFLGIGVIPPQAEWGSMINESRAYMQLAPWTVLAPGGAMVLTIMIFNYLGDSVRDLMDVSGQNDG